MDRKILPIKSTGNDAFEGKPHETLAGVIAKEIIKNKNKTIGIEGSWGTGKSNLVRLIEKELKKEHGDKYHFYVYDVWGHQEDLQRETFLTELVEFLTQSKDSPAFRGELKKTWTDKLKAVLSKKREISKTSEPRLSLGVVIAIFALIYSQVLGVFEAEIAKLSISIRILIAGWPFLLLLALVIYQFLKQFNKSDVDIKSKVKQAFKGAFSLYQDRQLHEDVSEITYESSSAVKHFRDWIKDIDDDLGNERLVIVFDNFDRVPPDCIRTTWSMINMFFCSEYDENSYIRITTIVPYDYDNIIEAFKRNEDDNKADDYIMKTFDIVYRIAKPIVSDWKLYFTEKWVEAGITDSESETLSWSLQTIEVVEKELTPRDVLVLINKVVVAKQLHKDIPEHHIVLFCLKERSLIDEPAKVILSQDFISGLEFIYQNDPEYQQNLAALIYQIEPQKAYQVVLEDEIMKNMVIRRDDAFLKLSEKDGFEQSLLNIVTRLSIMDEPVRSVNLLKTTGEDSEIMNKIWETIYRKACVNRIASTKYDPVHGIILRRISADKRTDWLEKVINDYYGIREFKAIDFLDCIDSFDKVIKKHSLDIDIFNILSPKEVSAEDYISISKAKGKAYSKYNLQVNGSSLDDFLAKKSIDEFLDPSFLVALLQKHELPKLKESISNGVIENKNNIDKLEMYLRVLKVFPKEEVLHIEMTDNDLVNMFRNIKGERDMYYDLIAMRLLRGSNLQYPYGSYFNSIMNSSDATFVDKVFDSLKHFATRQMLLKISFDNPDSALCKAITKLAVTKTIPVDSLHIHSMLEEFERICVPNDVDPYALINLLDRWNIHLRLSYDSLLSIPNYYFRAARNSRRRIAQRSNQMVGMYFGRRSKENWHEVFSDDKLLELLIISGFQKWNSNFMIALTEELTSIAETGIDGKDVANINRLLNKVISSGTSVSDIFKDVRDKIIINRTLRVDVFISFGRMLFEFGSLEEKADEFVRILLDSGLLNDLNCVELLLNEGVAFRSLINQCDKKINREIKKEIQRRIGNHSLNAKLAKALGVRPARN